MDGIKTKLTELSNAFKVAQDEGSEPPDLGHFVFRGSPGTGKTTVARVMAKILYDLGILGRDHVEETSGRPQLQLVLLTKSFVPKVKLWHGSCFCSVMICKPTIGEEKHRFIQQKCLKSRQIQT